MSAPLDGRSRPTTRRTTNRIDVDALRERQQAERRQAAARESSARHVERDHEIYETESRAPRVAARWTSAARVAPPRLISAATAAAAKAEPATLPYCHRGLCILALLLTVVSIPLVYSASIPIALTNHSGPHAFLIKQIEFVAAGLLVLWGVSRASALGLRRLVWVLFAVTVVGLLLTYCTPLGLVMGGVKRWLRLGPIQLQFSELAKIALIGVVAEFWSRATRYKEADATAWVWTAAIALPVVALVFVQPHFSAASLLFILPFVVAFYAGVSMKQLAQVGLVMVLLAGFGFVCMKPYQRERITHHFVSKDGDKEARGANYQALQGQRALIRGGLFGAGPGASLYKQGHLPAPHTDFILAVTGEEYGLLGVIGLLTVYALIVFFCFHVGHTASEPFEAMLCAGVGTLIGIQLLCNISVVTGLLPVTGMPLPLLSYGGSGLICSLLGLGLVLSVSRRIAETSEATPVAGTTTAAPPTARPTVALVR